VAVRPDGKRVAAESPTGHHHVPGEKRLALVQEWLAVQSPVRRASAPEGCRGVSL